MANKTISVFIDESGDFGDYEAHSPFYFVAIVLHDQSIDISENILSFERHVSYLGYPNHAVHTGPLIRRESNYETDLTENRKKLFNALFNFSRKLDIMYSCAMIQKTRDMDVILMTAQLSRKIADILNTYSEIWRNYERVIVYYDNGQIQLTKILTSVFSTLYSHVEFRKVQPVDYKLFQVADLICTLELLAKKDECNMWSNSEKNFFGTTRDFKKNYLKPIRKKMLPND